MTTPISSDARHRLAYVLAAAGLVFLFVAAGLIGWITAG